MKDNPTQPLVSVVMPAYNASQYVEQAVRSVLEQTYSNIELIVVNDGSTDDTLCRLSRFSDERLTVISQLNRGADVARNRGLEASRGEFVKFVDADDILCPEAIAIQVEQSAELAENEVVFGEADHIDADGNVFWHNSINPEEFKNQDQWLLLNWAMLTPCPLHRRALLMQVGGFDVCLQDGHERMLHFALSIAGVKFVYRPITVYQYRIHHDPNRISIQREVEMPNFADKVYYYDKALSLVQGKYGLAANGMTDYVAQCYFNLARRFYLFGAESKGRYCLCRVKEIPHTKRWPRYYGSHKLAKVYLWLGTWLGYRAAGKISEKLAKLTGISKLDEQSLGSAAYSPDASKQQ